MREAEMLEACGAVPVSEALAEDPGLASAASAVPLQRRDGTIMAFAMLDQADYDRLSGFRWGIDSKGYPTRWKRVGGRAGKLQRVSLAREVVGLRPEDSRQADHMNRNRLDARRLNLRIVTQRENKQNRAGWGKTSKYRGVSRFRDGRRWVATCQGDHLGLFDSEEEAADAAAKARELRMPGTLD